MRPMMSGAGAGARAGAAQEVRRLRLPPKTKLWRIRILIDRPLIKKGPGPGPRAADVASVSIFFSFFVAIGEIRTFNLWANSTAKRTC